MAGNRAQLVVIMALAVLFLGLITVVSDSGQPIWLVELLGAATLWRIQVGLVGVAGLSFLVLALQVISGG